MLHSNNLIYVKISCDRRNRYGMIGRIPDGRSARFQALLRGLPILEWLSSSLRCNKTPQPKNNRERYGWGDAARRFLKLLERND